MTTDQPSNRPMRQLLAEADQSLRDEQLANQLNSVTKDINNATPRAQHPRHHNEGVPHFVELTDKLYDAAVEAARRQVTRAESLLAQIEAEAEETRAKAKRRWLEIQELERNLEDMSAELLQSFARYNGVK